MADNKNQGVQNLDVELSRISDTIFEKANITRENMEKDLIEKYRLEKKKKETEFLEAAYKRIQASINTITSESNRQITYEKTMAKTELMALRNKITTEVYGGVEKRILEFIASKEYYGWLLALIMYETDKYTSGEFVITINKLDEKYKERLEKELNTTEKSVTIEFSNDNIIAGARIKNKSSNKIIDSALKGRFEQEKREFLRTSGLSLNTI